MASEHYIPGVQCPHCYEALSEKTRKRAGERQKQVVLANSRGKEHIGDGATIKG